jgi:hypothetical protein
MRNEPASKHPASSSATPSATQGQCRQAGRGRFKKEAMKKMWQRVMLILERAYAILQRQGERNWTFVASSSLFFFAAILAAYRGYWFHGAGMVTAGLTSVIYWGSGDNRARFVDIVSNSIVLMLFVIRSIYVSNWVTFVCAVVVVISYVNSLDHLWCVHFPTVLGFLFVR